MDDPPVRLKALLTRAALAEVLDLLPRVRQGGERNRPASRRLVSEPGAAASMDVRAGQETPVSGRMPSTGADVPRLVGKAVAGALHRRTRPRDPVASTLRIVAEGVAAPDADRVDWSSSFRPSHRCVRPTGNGRRPRRRGPSRNDRPRNLGAREDAPPVARRDRSARQSRRQRRRPRPAGGHRHRDRRVGPCDLPPSPVQHEHPATDPTRSGGVVREHRRAIDDRVGLHERRPAYRHPAAARHRHSAKFAVQLSPPLQPGDSTTLSYTCSGGQFVSDHYWRQALPRYTRHFTIRLRHRGAGQLASCTALEEHPDGAENTANEDLLWDYDGDDVLVTLTRDYLRPNQAMTLRWEVRRDPA